MSDERVTLELLGARTLAMGAELRDLQLRFGALESRFAALETTVNSRLGALESRFAPQEERMNRLIALVVRIAERLDALIIQPIGGPSFRDDPKGQARKPWTPAYSCI